MRQPTLIVMNERILGQLNLAPPADFVGADDIITNLAKEGEPRIKVNKICTLKLTNRRQFSMIYTFIDHKMTSKNV